MANYNFATSAANDLSKDESLLKNLPEEAQRVMSLLDKVENFSLSLRKTLVEELSVNNERGRER